MKTQYIILIVIVLTSLLSGQELKEVPPTYGTRPFPGFVPDAQTAKLIAGPVVDRLLGKEATGGTIYKAQLNGDVWTVTGHARMSGEPKLGQDVRSLRQPVLKINKMTGSMSFEVK